MEQIKKYTLENGEEATVTVAWKVADTGDARTQVIDGIPYVIEKTTGVEVVFDGVLPLAGQHYELAESETNTPAGEKDSASISQSGRTITYNRIVERAGSRFLNSRVFRTYTIDQLKAEFGEEYEEDGETFIDLKVDGELRLAPDRTKAGNFTAAYLNAPYWKGIDGWAVRDGVTPAK